MIAMNKPADAMQLLEKHFDTAFAAPDGIKKLRELILTLAMQGKLVPQDPNDPPARDLLKKIEAEKKRLVKEGKIKAQSPLPEIKPEDLPYTLPKRWEWVRLGSISEYIQRGKGPSYSDIKEIPVISQKCIQWRGFDKHAVRFIEPSTLDSYQAERFIQSGDLLWNSTGTGTLGRINIYRDELNAFKRVVADSHVTVVRLNGVCNDYVLQFLMSPFVQSGIEENASGTTNQIELNTSTVISQIIPLPPLAEQRRIVAKIDQLMARCDELEKLRAEHDQRRIAAHTAAMNRLLTATYVDTFSAAWAFIARNFGELYSVKENVAELRKAILQLAVMGKLVPQNPNDQPASKLLKEIATEKKRLVKEGKIKAPNPLPEIKPEEIPFELPKGWEWVRLGYMAEFINGDRGKNYPNRDEYVPEGIPWINTGHIEPDGSLAKRDMNFITREKFDSLNGGKIASGDLVYCLRGATFGKTAMVDPYTEGAIASSLMIIRPFSPCVNRYLYRYLVSPIGRSQIFRFDNGSAQPNLSANSVRLYVYPLPPVAEQRRIVAKIDQLMALCDELEQQIDAATGKRTALLNALMAQV
jgi:type I restriction enzyme S subunit